MIEIRIIHDDYDVVYCAPVDEKKLSEDGFNAVPHSSYPDGYAIALNIEKHKKEMGMVKWGFQHG